VGGNPGRTAGGAMILVCGASGRVGGEVVRQLQAKGAAVRCLVRDRLRARTALGDFVAVAQGDLDEGRGLGAALDGVSAMFLMSPAGASLAARQLAALRAATAAGVARVVKLSGSAWTMRPGRMTSTGAAHAAVEAAIKASGVAHAFLRPNAFMQTMLVRLRGELAAGDHFGLALGAARIALIDVRDIAAVAAHALTAPAAGNSALELSGPQAWSGDEIAALASTILGRTIAYRPLPGETAVAAAAARGEPPYVQQHLREVFALMAEGAAAQVTDTVGQMTGSTARPLTAWLREILGPVGR